MNDKKEMTARTSSVGADERQSLNVSVNSIAAYHLKINTFILKRRVCQVKCVNFFDFYMAVSF